jgi:hypothetical protein
MFIALEKWIASCRRDGKTHDTQSVALIDWLLAEPKRKRSARPGKNRSNRRER